MQTDSTMYDIQHKTVKSLGIMLSREFAMKIVAFLGQLVLFRLLTPKDFGLFTIIAFIINFFQIFTDIGLSSALIQSKEIPSREGLSAAFFLKQMLGITCFIIIILISPYLHLIYKNFGDQEIQMVRVLGLLLIVTPIQTFLTALLERDLRYEIISLIDVAGVIVYEIAAIIFALLKFSVWSFIFAILVKEFLQLILVVLYKRWTPVKRINKKELKQLLKFGVFVQAQGLLSFLHDALNPFIVGSRIGAYQVGLIDFSDGITSVNKQVTDNYGRIAFASLSRLQEYPDQLKKSINQAIVFLSIFSFYFALIVFGLGKDIIHYMFTDKWLPASTALYLMTIASVITSMYAPVFATLLATGKSKDISKIIFTTTLLEWTISIIGVKFGGYLAVPIAGIVTVTVAAIWTMQIVKIKNIWRDTLKTIIPKTLNIGILLLLINLINPWLQHTFFMLVLKVIFISLLYIAALYIFSRQEFLQVLKLRKYFLKT
jgi:PST family polysaccharide transporter/lipopolysaccharide exporter